MARRDEDNEEWDIGGLLFMILFVLVAAGFLLCTKPGNKLACDEGFAPTFIDCTKVK